MYKKFLASMSMLLMVSALAGCSKPQDSESSSDAAVPAIQEQMASPADSSASDESMPVDPQAMEPAQTAPSADTAPTQESTDANKDMKDGAKNDVKDMKDGAASMAPTSRNENTSGATGG